MTPSGPDSTSPAPTRRRLLAAGDLVGAGAFGGCTGLLGTTSGDGDDDPEGTADMPARVRLQELAILDCEAAAPSGFADLPTGERTIVDTALEEGGWTAPTEETPPAYDQFSERVEARCDTCGELVVSLRREETYYLVNGDHGIASTRATPDGETDA
jgi:hypothetical protein